ncbi:MAG: 2-C-methyl-D-erythritol 4-phosphate cytidylyltransferase [Candidatus Omnitrophica bacterium]|jgi:2-C-methyl-D-erythritol 4-phosphate cytidylyltransferase|nr:2-C-methyl-D-erythritol 4-phosphate cytidylyltransferase [Candidatus Omnitrophota bacterium]
MASRSAATQPRVGIIVPAAGRGERLGSRVPKPLVTLGGVPLVVYTLKVLFRAYPFAQILVPVEPEAVASMRRLLIRHGLAKAQVLAGGAMRAESVKNGFDLLRKEIEIVAVHDLARPFIAAENIRELVAAARKHGAALLAQKAVATVKETDAAGSVVRRTLDRNRIFLAQTPQVFRVSLLRKAYAAVGARFSAFTDEAALAEAAGNRIHIVAGPAMNFKITTPDDLKLARLVAESNKRKK